MYAHDECIYWGFGEAGLEWLAKIAGFKQVQSLQTVTVDGHPWIIGRLLG